MQWYAYFQGTPDTFVHSNESVSKHLFWAAESAAQKFSAIKMIRKLQENTSEETWGSFILSGAACVAFMRITFGSCFSKQKLKYLQNLFMMSLRLLLPKVNFDMVSFLATCMHNETAINMCGKENSCSGTAENFICICNGYGYKQGANNQECVESKAQFTGAYLRPGQTATMKLYLLSIFPIKIHHSCFAWSKTGL